VNTVRPARESDASAIAVLHAQRISDGFLASLGTSFLRRLYRRAVRSDGVVVVVAGDPPNLDGFVAVCEHTGRFYREFILRDGVVASVVAAPAFLRDPRKVWETFRYGMREGDDDGDLPAAEVLAVAVAEPAAGTGVGGRLLRAGLDELEKRGIVTARVVTAVDNEQALRLYEGAGFHRHSRTEVHAGVAQQVLVWP
jgi:ribosomal protein S18 acetylase RimI-like enzyme